MIKFHKDICFAWTSCTTAGLCFSQIDVVLCSIEISSICLNVHLWIF